MVGESGLRRNRTRDWSVERPHFGRTLPYGLAGLRLLLGNRLALVPLGGLLVRTG
jgi:hypothetical protein